MIYKNSLLTSQDSKWSSDTLWLYWEGPMPPYIQLCIDLLRAYNPTTVLLTPQSLPKEVFTDEIVASISTWHVCQRADAIRILLLYHFGGVWCDADCIPLRSFGFMNRIAHATRAGLVAYDSTDNTVGNGLLAAKARGQGISEMYARVTRVMQSGRTPKWLEVGSIPMTDVVKVLGRQSVPLFPLELVQPISWRDMKLMYAEGEENDRQKWLAGKPSVYCFLLSNQTLGDRIRTMTRYQLLRSSCLISFLLRASIKKLKQPVLSRDSKAVVTLNLYKDGFSENVRNSQRAAAQRWGADYVEISQPLFGWRDPYFEKLHLPKHAEGYGRVVYLERDVMVRSDCPNLFDCVEENAIGAVLAEPNGYSLEMNVEPKLDQIRQATGISVSYATQYINSGVLVFSPSLHADAFDAAVCCHNLIPDRSREIYDQGFLSAGILLSNTALQVLGCEYNRCVRGIPDEWTAEMDAYVWQFCGPKASSNMDKIKWAIS